MKCPNPANRTLAKVQTPISLPCALLQKVSLPITPSRETLSPRDRGSHRRSRPPVLHSQLSILFPLRTRQCSPLPRSPPPHPPEQPYAYLPAPTPCRRPSSSSSQHVLCPRIGPRPKTHRCVQYCSPVPTRRSPRSRLHS